MSELAMAIGNTDDARLYRDTYDQTITPFQSELFSDDRGLYRDGASTENSSLHANLFPLAFGLVPEDRKSGVASWLATQGMRCSVYAAQYLLEALFENGQANKALQLITAEGDRSWRHMLDSGATITWEAWDVKYKPNLDWNHAWGAAPANLLPRYVLGVKPLTPGWNTARIRPMPASLSFAEGKVPTPHGSIHIQWRREQGFQLVLELPGEMEAQLEVPDISGSTEIRINGEQVKAKKVGDYWVIEKPVTGNATVEVL